MTLEVATYGNGTAGASNQDPAGDTAYCVPVTVTADGLAIAIEFAIQGGIFGPAAYLLADDAGAPGDVLAICQSRATGATVSSTVRYVTAPLGYWITAGDFWIGVMSTQGLGSGQLRYTAGVSGDGTTIDSGVGAVLADPDSTGTTTTATDRAYSIRLQVLQESGGPPPPPPTPGGNRMGGTGAIRKPPRNG